MGSPFCDTKISGARRVGVISYMCLHVAVTLCATFHNECSDMINIMTTVFNFKRRVSPRGDIVSSLGLVLDP